MTFRKIYTEPQTIVKFIGVHTFLCQSILLNPIEDDGENVEWGD